ncbi:hypothetical protein [Nocardia inohanensis]|uniref:hypothetical protein n=1 Tax=Nocardia inohanensis TaxID=209246 RepID=UPI0008295393|nr:hypothetical protein [Nocardia inohanensis]
MFDPISLLTGAALLGGGWALGKYGRRSSKQAAQPAALCGCGHDLALHDRESGECHTETMRKTGYGIKEWARCPCRRYTGPTPLEEFFAPPPLPPS